MNPELNYVLARQHIADLQRNDDRTRLPSEVDARRRGSPDSTRSLTSSRESHVWSHGPRPQGYELQTTRLGLPAPATPSPS